jgi:SWIM zinc finger
MFNLDGMATCTCPDWLQCRGACKHLQAFQGHVLYHIQTGQLSWDGDFPASLQDAQDKQAKHGDRFNPPTKAISQSVYPNGYANPLPPPTMATSALPKKAPEMDQRVESSVMDIELEFVTYLDSEEMGLGSDLDSSPGNTEGSDAAGRSSYEGDKSQVMSHQACPCQTGSKGTLAHKQLLCHGCPAQLAHCI